MMVKFFFNIFPNMDDLPLWLKTEIPKKKSKAIVSLESPIPTRASRAVHSESGEALDAVGA
jgi:hypothetical protein